MPDAFMDIDVRDEIKALRRFLPGLEREARIAIRLRFWECMTIQQIAVILEISWESADRLIENAIAELRENFKKLENQKTLRTAS